MAAFDPLEELHAGALDAIAADAPADHIIFGVEIVAQKFVGQWPHGQLDAFGRTARPNSALGDGGGRMKLMGMAARAI